MDRGPYDQPHPYGGRLDVCPWCHRRPSVLPTAQDRWRVECQHDGCPMQPCSWGKATVAEAVDAWNYLIKDRR